MRKRLSSLGLHLSPLFLFAGALLRCGGGARRRLGFGFDAGLLFLLLTTTLLRCLLRRFRSAVSFPLGLFFSGLERARLVFQSRFFNAAGGFGCLSGSASLLRELLSPAAGLGSLLQSGAFRLGGRELNLDLRRGRKNLLFCLGRLWPPAPSSQNDNQREQEKK